jgi:hypothetical protein
MSLKLINIVDNKLVLNGTKTIENSYVISILGDARKGKSTLLNLIINHMKNSEDVHFKMSSSIEHCTRGIDYVLLKNVKNVKNENYIFIDCQGLNYENSSNDSKLLLFIYSISNIFIYNDSKILNNNVFTTLQPMALFLNSFLDKSTDTILYFRINDYDLDEEPKELLKKTFNPLGLENDQHSNVRSSITKLFKNILINVTESLSKNEKNLLKNNKLVEFLEFNSVLNNEEGSKNTFQNIIVEIFDLVKTTNKKNIDLEKLVSEINNNNNIDYKKLDIYTLNTIIEINNFIEINIVKNDDFLLFNITGYNDCRIDIDNYKLNITKCIETFNKRFSTVPDDLKKIFFDAIDILIGKYETMKNKNEDIATSILEEAYNRKIKDLCNNVDKKIVNAYKKVGTSDECCIYELLEDEDQNYYDIYYDFKEFTREFTYSNIYADLDSCNHHGDDDYLHIYKYFGVEFGVDYGYNNYFLELQKYDLNIINNYNEKIQNYFIIIYEKINSILEFNQTKITKKIEEMIKINGILYFDKLIKKNNKLMNIDILENGNLQQFISKNNPYTNILLDNLMSLNEHGVEYNLQIDCQDIIKIKNLYVKKYTEYILNVKSDEYFECILQIINNNGLLTLSDTSKYCILKPIFESKNCNLNFVELHMNVYMKNNPQSNDIYYVEYFQFYHILQFFNIDEKIFKLISNVNTQVKQQINEHNIIKFYQSEITKKFMIDLEIAILQKIMNKENLFFMTLEQNKILQDYVEKNIE